MNAPPAEVSWLADIASIASLLGTAYVSTAVYRLRRAYTAQAVVPELKARIIELASDLLEMQLEFETHKTEIKYRLGILESNLASLQGKIPASRRPRVRTLIQAINTYESSPGNEHRGAVSEIYRQTQKLIEELNILDREQQWQR